MLLIFAWECFRYAVTSAWDIAYNQTKRQELDECNRCGARVPDIQFHMKRCPYRFKYQAHYGSERSHRELDGVYNPDDLPLIKK